MIDRSLKQAFIAYLRSKWYLYLFVFLFFLSGVIFGASGVKFLQPGQSSELNAYVDVFINSLDTTEINSHALARDVIIKNLSIMGAFYILGLTVIGLPFILLLVFTRGFALGFTVGFLVKEKALHGVLFSLLSILPQNIINIPVLFIGSAAALSFSITLLRGRFIDRSFKIARYFVGYTLIMLALSILSIGGGLTEAYITPVFLKMLAEYL